MLSIRKTPRHARRWGIVLALCLGACSAQDEPGGVRAIGALRPIDAQQQAPRLFASSAERFGLATPAAANDSGFSYTTPAGWSERAPTDMRTINFQIGAAGAECYVTVLGGDGGGTLANINRWSGQLKARSWGQADLDAAPRLGMFGNEAVLVELADDTSERMLLGALARMESKSVFVKLTGSRAQVEGERASFAAFCTSLARKP